MGGGQSYWRAQKRHRSGYGRVVYPCHALSALTGDPVDYAALFSRIDGVLSGHTKCDLSVVSDLKTVQIPCCCGQRRRGSDTPLIYGKTAVDLNSVSGSTLGAAFLVLVSFCMKEEG